MVRRFVVASLTLSVLLVSVGPLWAVEETTTTEAATTVANGDAGQEVDWWILLVVGFGIIVLVWAIARAGRRKDVYVAPSDPGWKPKARAGYADARWLFDTMDEDIAIWRGNAQFDGTTAPGSTAETAKADAWDAIAGRMDGARDNLYGLEAAAPDKRTAETARRVVDALAATRTALDARAEARYNYRTVDAGETDEVTRPNTLAEARDRELRSAQNLDTERRGLGDALTKLSAIT